MPRCRAPRRRCPARRLGPRNCGRVALPGAWRGRRCGASGRIGGCGEHRPVHLAADLRGDLRGGVGAAVNKTAGTADVPSQEQNGKLTRHARGPCCVPRGNVPREWSPGDNDARGDASLADPLGSTGHGTAGDASPTNSAKKWAALSHEQRAAQALRLREFRKRNPQKNREKNQIWREQHPEKNSAHKAVAYALARGRIERKPCERCGKHGRVHAHHDDYSRPLDVMWLCPNHHRERHRELAAQGASEGPANGRSLVDSSLNSPRRCLTNPAGAFF